MIHPHHIKRSGKVDLYHNGVKVELWATDAVRVLSEHADEYSLEAPRPKRSKPVAVKDMPYDVEQDVSDQEELK